MIFLFVFILFHFLADAFVSFYLIGYSFGTFDLGIIVSKMRQYISSYGGFRFVMRNHYFGASGRSDLPDLLLGVHLDPAYFQKWPQSITFECREVRKRKGSELSGCPFSVRVAFDRSVGSYVVKLCKCLHIGHVVNLSSIAGHVKFESDLSVNERERAVGKFWQNWIHWSAIQRCAFLFIFLPCVRFRHDLSCC